MDLVDQNTFFYSEKKVAEKLKTRISTTDSKNRIVRKREKEDLPIEKFSFQTTKMIEKSTRFFPFMDTDTILFSSRQTDSLKSILHPIKRAFMVQETLDETDMNQTMKAIRNLFEMGKANEPKLFTTKITVSKRRKNYEK